MVHSAVAVIMFRDLQDVAGIDRPAGLVRAERAQLGGVEVVQAESFDRRINAPGGEGAGVVEHVVDRAQRAAPRHGQVLHSSTPGIRFAESCVVVSGH